MGFHHSCLRLRRSPLGEPCAGIWRLDQTVNGEARSLCRRRRRQGVVGGGYPHASALQTIWPRAVLISSLRWHGGSGANKGHSKQAYHGKPVPRAGAGTRVGMEGLVRLGGSWAAERATARQVLQNTRGWLGGQDARTEAWEGRQGRPRHPRGISWQRCCFSRPEPRWLTKGRKG